jgi:hypothetical protein
MKTDPEYLKRLLAAFKNAPHPTTDLIELERAGFTRSDPKFEFHIAYLRHKGYLEVDDEGMAMLKHADQHIQSSVIPFRLTPTGHKFAEGDGKHNSNGMSIIIC